MSPHNGGITTVDKSSTLSPVTKVLPKMGYILVDFDRTLAHYESWEKNGKALGLPIRPMVERVTRWLLDGMEVKIFTARASVNNPRQKEDIEAIESWCMEEIGECLEVTNEKDFDCLAIIDDLAVSVVPNTGEALVNFSLDPLSPEEEKKLLGMTTTPAIAR